MYFGCHKGDTTEFRMYFKDKETLSYWSKTIPSGKDFNTNQTNACVRDYKLTCLCIVFL